MSLHFSMKSLFHSC